MKKKADRGRAHPALDVVSFLNDARAALAVADPRLLAVRFADLLVPRVGDWCVIDLEIDGALQRAAARGALAGREDLVEALQSMPAEPRWYAERASSLLAGPPVVFDDAAVLDEAARSDEERAIFRAIGARSVVLAPLRTSDRFVGCVTVVRAESDAAFTALDAARIGALADRAALVLELSRAREQTETVARMKDEFLAMVSHELRAPLAALLMWEHVARSPGVDAATRARALDAMHESAVHQSHLVEDLLDLARTSTGRLTLATEPLALSGPVEAALAAVRHAAERKSVTIVAELDLPVPLVEGDAVRLRQIATNLLDNAVKFAPARGQVRVAIEPCQGGVRLIVEDDGEGIDPSLRARVFEPFVQGEDTSTRFHGGLGIGLTLVRSLVEHHGGTVRVEERAQGKGARFVVELPAARYERVPTDPRLRELERRIRSDERRALAGRSILIVEDDAAMRDATATVLSGLGARVRTAGETRAAMDAILVAAPEVLLSDIAMPGEDGYSLVHRVRALEVRGGTRIRALAVTARASEADRRRALAAGFDAHLAKPFSAEELISAIAALLDDVA